MSLKFTAKETIGKFAPVSCLDWAYIAINSDKVEGNTGFDGLNISGWYYPYHYKNIINSDPGTSPISALAEMAEVKQKVKDAIMWKAGEIDGLIMILGKMESEIKQVEGEER